MQLSEMNGSLRVKEKILFKGSLAMKPWLIIYFTLLLRYVNVLQKIVLLKGLTAMIE